MKNWCNASIREISYKTSDINNLITGVQDTSYNDKIGYLV